MNYHSDLDLMMIYEGDGRTARPPASSRHERFELTDNFHFFTELAQRIIKALSQIGPMGRLYQVDMRLRPTGKSGSLVLPLCEFRRYFMAGHEVAAHPEGGAQLWERQALTRARVVYGDARLRPRGDGGGGGGGVRPALAAGVGGRDRRHARAAGSEPAGPRPEARAGRTGGRRVPGADVSTGARQGTSRHCG